MSAGVFDVRLDRLDPNGRNPRRAFDVADLARSMREYGLLQPILVRPHPTSSERYEVVAGHRRLAAARLLGWRHIPATVRAADADEAYLLTVVENLQRQDLTPLEESAALEVLVRERGWSTRQVASAVKRSQSYVSRRLRVFEDPVVGPLVLRDRLGVSVAEELLPLPASRKRRLAQRAAQQRWDRAQLRLAIQAVEPARPARGTASLVARTRAFREALRAAAANNLTESERRELRLAFQELAALARSPTDAGEIASSRSRWPVAPGTTFALIGGSGVAGLF